MEKKISMEKEKSALNKGFKKAKEVLNDDSKTEKLLQQIESKLKMIPFAGDKLANIPIFASLLRSVFKKEYTEIPVGSLVAVTSALIYFVSPIDLIPDFLIGAGFVDDAAVAAVCYKLVKSDIDDYLKWRSTNSKQLI